MAVAYLGLGSNLGDRIASLRTALHRLSERVRIVAVSPVYETEPVGYRDQPWFLNAVVAGRTELTPTDLLAFVKQIEADLGRQPSFVNAPRPVDVDILLYDRLLVRTPDLTIPHPRLATRAFVLRPLADLAPDLQHPEIGRSIREILATLPPGPAVEQTELSLEVRW